MALPRDSYLQDYFADVTSVMRVGPPVFFVVRDLNMSRHAPDTNRVCSISGCDDSSLLNQVRSLVRSDMQDSAGPSEGTWCGASKCVNGAGSLAPSWMATQCVAADVIALPVLWGVCAVGAWQENMMALGSDWIKDSPHELLLCSAVRTD